MTTFLLFVLVLLVIVSQEARRFLMELALAFILANIVWMIVRHHA